MIAHSGLDVAALVTAALLVGFAKTGLSGTGMVSVALFATVLPARESTGVLLPLLLVGDVVAVLAYRRHADRPALLRLVPSVLVGVLLGVVLLAVAEDTAVRRTIGVVLLVLVAVQVLQRRSLGSRPGRRSPTVRGGGVGRTASRAATPETWHVPAAVFGGLAGFTTMVANAGGAAMALHLLAARVDKLVLLGTSAWFFLVVNAVKVPFSIALGLLDEEALRMDAALAPVVLVGAALGMVVVRRIPQARFEQAVLALTALAAANLLA